MKKKIAFFVIILLISNYITVFMLDKVAVAQDNLIFDNSTISKDVRVKLDGKLLEFDVPPMIINDRTLVPFRGILEALGAEVEWDGNTRTVSAIKDDLTIILQIDNKMASINREVTYLDVPPKIIDGRTLIPARFISEALRCQVDWDNSTRTVIISTSYEKTNSDKEFSFQGITIGELEKKVIEILGQPARKDLSKYGFMWYIYNQDYSKYIQVGIKDGKVVGIYTNATGWKSKKGITIGTPKTDVNNKYDELLSGIKKGNIIYSLDDSQGDTYLIDDYYVTIFYDYHNGNTVTSVLLIEKETEEALDGFFGKESDELRKSYERQIFDLANAIRARFKEAYFTWNNAVANTAREHSEDMAHRNFFSHINPDGKSPADRVEDNNLQYMMVSENIAAGYTNAIFAHEAWMNSEGHRKNILGNCEQLGVGVHFGGSYNIYYTQNFYTPIE